MSAGFLVWLKNNDITLDWEFAGTEKFYQCTCNNIFVTGTSSLDALTKCYEQYLKINTN